MPYIIAAIPKYTGNSINHGANSINTYHTNKNGNSDFIYPTIHIFLLEI